MGLLGKVKLKGQEALAYWFIGKVAIDLERGKYGPTWQALYVSTKGYKTLIGVLLFAILQALDTFQPPWLDSSNFVLRLACGGLTAFGILDKAFRREPIAPAWVLDALATVTAWIGYATGPSGTLLHLLPTLYPGDVTVEHWSLTTALWLDAATTACAFLNRVLRANAAPAPPKPAEATALP